MKSPIKDGLNFKCLGAVKELMPEKSIISSFLFYSGALELNLATSNRFIVAHTNRPLVYEFWQHASGDPSHVAAQSKFFFDNLLQDDSLFSIEKMFTTLQETWFKRKDPDARAAYFFLLNRCSERGLVSSGKLDKKYFNPVSLSHMKNFKPKNFFIKFDSQENFLDALPEEDGSKYLLFPVGECSRNLFEVAKNRGAETTPIHHHKLSEAIKQQDKKWVVLYKNHKRVFDLYKGHHIILVDEYGRQTNRKDKCEDIVIANF